MRLQIAKLLFKQAFEGPFHCVAPLRWEDLSAKDRDYYLRIVDTVITALAAPTPEMVKAAFIPLVGFFDEYMMDHRRGEIDASIRAAIIAAIRKAGEA